MEIKAKNLSVNKPYKVKSILIKDNGKTSFSENSEKRAAFFIVDENQNRWVVEIRDGKEVGRWNFDHIIYVEWVQE